MEYLEKLPPFGENQVLPEDDIIKLVGFFMPSECQKELIIQGFDSTTQGLTEIFNFCERLETAKNVFLTQGKGPHSNRKQYIW